MNNFGYGGYGSYSFSPFTPNPYNYSNTNGYNYNNSLLNGQTMTQPSLPNTYAYVNGLEGAKAYLVPPNTTVMLMDSDNPIFYLKSANQQGQATIRQFRFEEVLEQSQNKQVAQSVDLSGYVKREEFEEIKTKLEDVINSSKNKGAKTNG